MKRYISAIVFASALFTNAQTDASPTYTVSPPAPTNESPFKKVINIEEAREELTMDRPIDTSAEYGMRMLESAEANCPKGPSHIERDLVEEKLANGRNAHHYEVVWSCEIDNFDDSNTVHRITARFTMYDVLPIWLSSFKSEVIMPK